MSFKALFFLPELFLFFMCMKIFVVNLFRVSKTSDAILSPAVLSRLEYYAFFSIGVLLLGSLWVHYPVSKVLSFDGLLSSKLTIMAKFVIFFFGLPWLGVGSKTIRRALQRENMRSFEYPSLLLFSMIGSFLLVSAHNFSILFVALILQILPIFIISLLYEEKTSATAWSARYFFLEGITLSLFVFGAALIYGAVGDLDFKSIALFCQTLSHSKGEGSLWILIGFFMLLLTFLFRLAAFPFHIWIKGVYESSSNLMIPFMAILSFSLIVGLSRLLFEVFYDFVGTWKVVLFYVGISSGALGAIGSLFQSRIRCFFSYTYMFHLGMVFLGLSSGMVEGVQSSLLYWIIYTFSVGAFFFFWSNLSINDQMLERVDQVYGLSIKYPGLSLLMAITLLSLASIPPFAGFWCKLYILKSLILNGWIYVAVLLSFSIIASLQYFHIIRTLYFSDRCAEIDIISDWKTSWVFAPIALVFFFFFQDQILALLSDSLRGL
ncbi:proton-conducting transporter membrane subunit [Alphaproteobacteria bacterium]|nr:proton-conducting transporter membrane subunit [Alphaproteobacteria bacterium]